jgi:hypothetical protein
MLVDRRESAKDVSGTGSATVQLCDATLYSGVTDDARCPCMTCVDGRCLSCCPRVCVPSSASESWLPSSRMLDIRIQLCT